MRGRKRTRWAFSSAGPRPRSAGGFTLVEMLLATALSIVLLLALWATFDIFTKLFEKGQARVERAQLCRALMEQISDDLRAAIQDPVGGSVAEPHGPVPVRRFGLFGTASTLRFDVLQVTPEQANPVPVGHASAAESADVSRARVPELRTVYYEFRSPGVGNVERSGDGIPTGLVRREQDFETPIGEDDELDLAGAGLASSASGGAAETADGLSEAEFQDPVDASMVWVPEVVGVEFRYYDGNAWTSSWNSLQRKSLPAAVEVTLRMVDSTSHAEEAQPASSALAAEPAAGERSSPESLDAMPGEQQTSGPPTSTFRVVIDLPGSPAYRKPRPAAKPVPRPRVRMPVRRIAPRRLPSTRRPPVRIVPEEWIRTQSP